MRDSFDLAAWRVKTEIPNHRHRPLLCACRERRRRRAAEQRDEDATGHRMTAFANALRASCA